MQVDKHHYVSSATNALTPAPQKYVYQQEVAKLIDTTICIGCKACQVACSEWNDYRPDVGHNVGVYDNPADLGPNAWTVMRYNEVEENGKLQWLIRKDGCMHCEKPGCQIACPVPGAIVQHANGIVDIVQDLCTGCGYCIAGCPFDVPKQNPIDKRVYKCNLCVDRVFAGQAPSCAKTCPTSAIMFGSKADMITRAEKRIAELKSRGFANAGLYDPEGVGGTHVMYVLHHADRPELYSDLPKNPTISPMVRFWKGAFKPLAAVGFIAMFAAAALHYIGVGPVAEDDEEEKKHD